MKKALLLLIIVIYSLTALAQKSAKDIIYPADQSKPIIICTIIKIEKGNIVTYNRKGSKQSIEAIAVKRDGKHIDLSEFVAKPIVEKPETLASVVRAPQKETINKNDYLYYSELYDQAKRRKGLGGGLVFVGLSGAALSYFVMIKPNSYSPPKSGLIVFAVSFVIINIGTPVWISNSIKAANNKEAMAKYKKPEASLNIGVTSDGLGLVYRF